MEEQSLYYPEQFDFDREQHEKVIMMMTMAILRMMLVMMIIIVVVDVYDDVGYNVGDVIDDD